MPVISHFQAVTFHDETFRVHMSAWVNRSARKMVHWQAGPHWGPRGMGCSVWMKNKSVLSHWSLQVFDAAALLILSWLTVFFSKISFYDKDELNL